jgi:rhodanese-related sulfurtransferase
MSDVAATAPPTDPDTTDPVVDDDDVREARRQQEHARAVAGDDPLVPEIGVLPQAVRLFRVNWIAALDRSPSGAPLLDPAFVAGAGRGVRLVDIRTPAEVTGATGFIPGSDFVPVADFNDDVIAGLGRDEPLVLIAQGDERSMAIAHRLEARGLRMVAALRGGVLAWRAQGFATSRDRRILERRGRLRALSSPPEPTTRHLDLDEVRAHIGDPFAVRMMKLAALLLHGRLSCVDGRDDTGVIGTPGGDGGEFMLALAALERVTGQHLDDHALERLLRRRLDTFGRFYIHSDVSAGNAFVKALRADRRFDDALKGVWHSHEWRRFLVQPPPALREALLDVWVQPGHVGCGHLRLQWQHAVDYGTRGVLVEQFLRRFLSLRWQGALEAEYVTLGGGHKEGAVLNVVVDGGLHGFSTIPLVSPSTGSQQMFVNHPQVAAWLRRELVEFLALQDDVVDLRAGRREALLAKVERLGQQQLLATLQRLAPGLPIYTVTFRRDGTTDVTFDGHVPDPGAGVAHGH